MNLSTIFELSQHHLKNWKLIKVEGSDRLNFFQGQVTNDLNQLEQDHGHLTCRLNRVGKLQSFFYIAKKSDSLLLLCPEELVNPVLEDFSKYIVMDDVVMTELALDLWLVINPILKKAELDQEFLFDFLFYGLNATLYAGEPKNLNNIIESELEEIRILNAWPKWGVDVNSTQFINESMLNTYAISYSKGCFLGQETVAKIENNRGAAYFPVLIKLDCLSNLSEFINKELFVEKGNEKFKVGVLKYQVGDYLQVNLLRDYRVDQRILSFEIENTNYRGTIEYLPHFKSSSYNEIASELYYLGIEAFQKNKIMDSIELIQRAIMFNSDLADAYESLGVIFGREEKYEEAISWMNKLLDVNPNSVMAHTNKSLYLMKLGKIEEAEAEKSLATIKSFASFGEEAKLKKIIIEEEKKKENEILRREAMFKQVLEIDPDDTIALFGMADIYYLRRDYSNAKSNLEKVIQLEATYSMAYLLLGKCFEQLSEVKPALNIYEKGIIVASKRGDMMPANEMQSRLNQLIVSASFA